jgi:hypothetical protein
MPPLTPDDKQRFKEEMERVGDEISESQQGWKFWRLMNGWFGLWPDSKEQSHD